MSLDDVLIAVLLGGAGLSALYVRAEYIRWRQSGADQMRRESAQRVLHSVRLSQQRIADRAARALPLHKFRRGDVASNDAASTSRSAARNDAQRNYEFFERRKHPRSRDSMSAN